MLTARHIVTGAMRKLGVLPIGRSATAAQAEDAMEILNALYAELVGMGVFGKLIDTIVTDATYTAHEQERVHCSSAVTTVTIPDTITQEWFPSAGYIGAAYDYGWNTSALAIYPRSPRDNAIIQVAKTNTNTTLTYIYDAPRAKWQPIATLVLGNDAPLSERYGEALKAKLAEKMAASYNVEPNPFLLREVAIANAMLSHRYDRAYRPVSGAYF